MHLIYDVSHNIAKVCIILHIHKAASVTLPITILKVSYRRIELDSSCQSCMKHGH